jgi:sterol desaturase/sphingolipid hydroxylase (fatty acid hydroxylase superfamily)
MGVAAGVVFELIVLPAGLAAILWARQYDFGLFNWMPLPLWAELPVAFLLLDFTFYYWHRLNHRWSLLWRFHNVHHIDADLDVSTSIRFHFGEMALSAIFRVLQLGLLGVSPATFLLFEVSFAMATMFHHSNWHLPFRLESLLNRVFVTPRMHTIHHSIVERETDSNFSTIFSWWDRLNVTFRAFEPQAKTVIGVPAYQDRADQTLSAALLLPFRKQRDYWKPR